MKKKIMITLIALLTIAASGKAMSYEQARNEALFLTDKMAYELNLTDTQYEAAYEINLDYLMGVTSRDDVYGVYWERRNLDLSYILLDWQWEAFRAASYFFRPLYWLDGFWHFAIYGRYPHRDYFYYGRPAFYATYRGGHAWHVVGGHGYYHNHRDHFRQGRSLPSRPHRGITTHHGGPRTSSTQSTVNRPSHHFDRPTTHNNSGGSLGRSHESNRTTQSSSGSLGRSHESNRTTQSSGGSLGRSHSSGSFGGGNVSRSSRSSSSSAGRSSSGGHSYGGRR